MVCSHCGNQINPGETFCRKCGTDLRGAFLSPAGQNQLFTGQAAKDPVQLTASGIGKIVIGDGFFMVGVLLSFMQSSVTSLLWLLLLIPAFFFFGIGLADVIQAKQIRQRLKQNQLEGAAKAELTPPRASVADIIKNSGQLISPSGAADKTTRELK